MFLGFIKVGLLGSQNFVACRKNWVCYLVLFLYAGKDHRFGFLSIECAGREDIGLEIY